MAEALPAAGSAAPSPLAALSRLALPIIFVNLGNMMLGVVDLIIAKKVGPMAQSAVGLGNSISHFGHMFGLGLALGTDPLIAQALGGGQPRLARRAMWQGIYSVLVVALPIALIVASFALPLRRFYDPELADATRAFLGPRVLGFLPFHLFIAVRAYLQANHITWPMIVSTVSANILNAVLGWSLALGVPSLGIEPLGVRGLAWASTASFILQASILAVCVRTVPVPAGPERVAAFDAAIFRKVFQYGLPVTGQVLAEGGVFAFVGMIAATMSPTAVAAHQVAIQLAILTFMIPLGISIATAVFVGRSIGSGDTPGGRRIGFFAIRLGGLSMAGAGAFMILFPGFIGQALGADERIASLATDLIRIAAVFQVFDGVQTVACGALRGVGQTRWPFIVNVIGYWVLGLPIGLLLAYPLKMGVAGLWWGLTLGLVCTSITLTWRFHRATIRHVASVWQA